MLGHRSCSLTLHEAKGANEMFPSQLAYVAAVLVTTVVAFTPRREVFTGIKPGSKVLFVTDFEASAHVIAIHMSDSPYILVASCRTPATIINTFGPYDSSSDRAHAPSRAVRRTWLGAQSGPSQRICFAAIVCISVYCRRVLLQHQSDTVCRDQLLGSIGCMRRSLRRTWQVELSSDCQSDLITSEFVCNGI
jgi:hypothetical protein